METYLVVIGRTATGYSAHCPDVLGCASVGKTVDQVVKNMKKALEFHFEGMAEDGDPIPKSSGIKAYKTFATELDLSQYLLTHIQVDTTRFATAVPV